MHSSRLGGRSSARILSPTQHSQLPALSPQQFLSRVLRYHARRANVTLASTSQQQPLTDEAWTLGDGEQDTSQPPRKSSHRVFRVQVRIIVSFIAANIHSDGPSDLVAL